MPSISVPRPSAAHFPLLLSVLLNQAHSMSPVPHPSMEEPVTLCSMRATLLPQPSHLPTQVRRPPRSPTTHQSISLQPQSVQADSRSYQMVPSHNQGPLLPQERPRSPREPPTISRSLEGTTSVPLPLSLLITSPSTIPMPSISVPRPSAAHFPLLLQGLLPILEMSSSVPPQRLPRVQQTISRSTILTILPPSLSRTATMSPSTIPMPSISVPRPSAAHFPLLLSVLLNQAHSMSPVPHPSMEEPVTLCSMRATLLPQPSHLPTQVRRPPRSPTTHQSISLQPQSVQADSRSYQMVPSHNQGPLLPQERPRSPREPPTISRSLEGTTSVPLPLSLLITSPSTIPMPSISVPRPSAAHFPLLLQGLLPILEMSSSVPPQRLPRVQQTISRSTILTILPPSLSRTVRMSPLTIPMPSISVPRPSAAHFPLLLQGLLPILEMSSSVPPQRLPRVQRTISRSTILTILPPSLSRTATMSPSTIPMPSISVPRPSAAHFPLLLSVLLNQAHSMSPVPHPSMEEPVTLCSMRATLLPQPSHLPTQVRRPPRSPTTHQSISLQPQSVQADSRSYQMVPSRNQGPLLPQERPRSPREPPTISRSLEGTTSVPLPLSLLITSPSTIPMPSISVPRPSAAHFPLLLQGLLPILEMSSSVPPQRLPRVQQTISRSTILTILPPSLSRTVRMSPLTIPMPSISVPRPSAAHFPLLLSVLLNQAHSMSPVPHPSMEEPVTLCSMRATLLPQPSHLPTQVRRPPRSPTTHQSISLQPQSVQADSRSYQMVPSRNQGPLLLQERPRSPREPPTISRSLEGTTSVPLPLSLLITSPSTIPMPSISVPRPSAAHFPLLLQGLLPILEMSSSVPPQRLPRVQRTISRSTILTILPPSLSRTVRMSPLTIPMPSISVPRPSAAHFPLLLQGLLPILGMSSSVPPQRLPRVQQTISRSTILTILPPSLSRTATMSPSTIPMPSISVPRPSAAHFPLLLQGLLPILEMSSSVPPQRLPRVQQTISRSTILTILPPSLSRTATMSPSTIPMPSISVPRPSAAHFPLRCRGYYRFWKCRRQFHHNACRGCSKRYHAQQF